MTRGPLLAPAHLTPDQRALYDELCGGPRADASRPNGPVDAQGRLTGPFNAMLHSPAVGGPLQRLGAALRYESTLDDVVRELVILLVAAHYGSAYERWAHERVARGLGVDDQTLATVAAGDTLLPCEGLPATALPALDLARALLDDDLPGADEFAQLEEVLGDAGIFEVNTLVGYYGMLARQLALFDAQPPEAP